MLRASEKARKPRVHIFDGPSNEDLPFFMEEIKKIKMEELLLTSGEGNSEVPVDQVSVPQRQNHWSHWDKLQLEKEEKEIQNLKEEIQRLQVTKKELFQKLKQVLMEEKREKRENFP
jgi:hypothetical protein